MTRWQADEHNTMRLFRLHEARMSDEAFERTRRRILRKARQLRWRHRAAQAWRMATANAWDIVLAVVVLAWLLTR